MPEGMRGHPAEGWPAVQRGMGIHSGRGFSWPPAIVFCRQ